MKHLTLAAVMFCAIGVHAQTDIPTIVTDGLASYQESGGKEAMTVWLKGSTLENDTTTRVNVSGLLVQIETAYGKMTGFEPIRIVSVAPSLRRVYVMLKFEKGPVFSIFDCYKAEKDWIIARLDFHTIASNILPQSILAGER